MLAGSAGAACMGPAPLSSQAIDSSGMAANIRWTTSRLGLLRPERMWLTMGRAMPIASANWVGVSCRAPSRALMRSTIVIKEHLLQMYEANANWGKGFVVYK